MERPRKQTYTLEMYLGKMKDLDIRSDQTVQRLSGQWNNAMTNELIFSVLNGEYIPPIILGQEASSQLYIVDGLQRSASLMMFRHGNYKITSSLEEPVIKYRAKAVDADAMPKFDGNGDLVWEEKEFDLRRKTYDKLPEELKKTFNEFQLDCIIHENYSQEQISRLVRRYNHLKPMTVSQKAFTFCDRHARKIRGILKRNFFVECTGYTKNERKNGTLERIILESVMAMFHLDNWKKSAQIGAYVNENSSEGEFDILENCVERLENIVTDDLYPLFTSKDSFLFFGLFHKFTKLGLPDGKYADFLHAFQNDLGGKEVNGKVFYERGRSLKDRTVIVEKLDLLETLMHEYLYIPKAEPEPDDTLEFVRENVSPDIAREDIEQFAEVLDGLAEKSGYDGKLMEASNRPSMVAVIAHSFESDIDLDDWFADYCGRNDGYVADQAENFERMMADLQKYLGLESAA